MQDSNETEKRLILDSRSQSGDSACSVLESGDICPACHKGRMAYDGFLILTCPECGFRMGGGGFT